MIRLSQPLCISDYYQTMLSKADIKHITALHRAKERHRAGLFLAEGYKLVGDMLPAYRCKLLVLSSEAYELMREGLQELSPEFRPERVACVEANFDFRRISTQVSPQPVLALFHLPTPTAIQAPESGLALLLDEVQDPGNVGTIIRTADWFGIRQVYLTSGCADAFAPKVLQATMGALSRVRVQRLSEVEDLLADFRGEVLGAFLEGESIYSLAKPKYDNPCLLVVGNEGRGISAEVAGYISRRITIPAYDPDNKGSESLNVAVATAICLSELRKSN